MSKFWSFITSLSIICIGFVGCTNKNSAVNWYGYTVGDFVYIASPLGGRLEKIDVSPGDTVHIGSQLYELESESEVAVREESASRLDNVKSITNNLSKGRRLEEIRVIEAQLAQALAGQNYADSSLKRDQQTYEIGGLSKADLEIVINNAQQAAKKVEELRASLEVAKLPSRTDEVLAARANIIAAQNVLKQSEWQLSQKHQTSKVDGTVYELFFRIGEYVAPSQPVLSILPPKNIKVRFFVPETDLPSIQVGKSVVVNCDGCKKDISVKVSRIGTQAEYTPPVIYSNSQRNKLMFLIEAYPSPEDAINLHPGQPIDISQLPQNNRNSN